MKLTGLDILYLLTFLGVVAVACLLAYALTFCGGNEVNPSEIEKLRIELHDIRSERDAARKQTAYHKARYDSLYQSVRTTPEIIYIVKSNHDEKLNTHARFNLDDHLQYISDWLPIQDSLRRRYSSGLPSVAN
jgi:hypothetical protein